MKPDSSPPIPVRLALGIVLGLLLFGCGSEPADPPRPAPALEPTGLVIDYPPDGAVFPPDFTTPTFLWHDDTAKVDVFRITFTGSAFA